MARRLAAACVVVSLLACREVATNLVSDAPPASKDAGRDAGRDASVDAAAPTGDAAVMATDGGPTKCGKRICQCDDGKDSDRDELVDGLDPECTGPFDDDERSFGTGTPIAKGPCRDCFWDDNGGSGDDDCWYPSACVAGKTPPASAACSSCEVSDACVSACAARTPNGCDCFGCCAVTRADDTVVLVELQDTCALDKLDDTKACPRCVQSTQCMNPCGRCELCIGRTPSDLPSDCSANQPEPGPGYVCEEGQQVCSVDALCGETAYCQLGCCLPTVF